MKLAQSSVMTRYTLAGFAVEEDLHSARFEIDMAALAQLQLTETFARDFCLDDVTFVDGLQLQPDQWASGVNVADNGMQRGLAVLLGKYVNIMRTYISQRITVLHAMVIIQAESQIADMGLTFVYAAMELVHIAEEFVDKGRGRVVIDFLWRAICSIRPWFITTIRSATSSASS